MRSTSKQRPPHLAASKTPRGNTGYDGFGISRLLRIPRPSWAFFRLRHAGGASLCHGIFSLLTPRNPKAHHGDTSTFWVTGLASDEVRRVTCHSVILIGNKTG
ncbi:hypothetical protein CBS76997_4015 [Aspergillus niger]|nr:hypothetical protein CBS13152_7897 [Aspergillus niger]KAI3046705.1 hypothetical protein CBS76997_4015 [Aspergillus niger]